MRDDRRDDERSEGTRSTAGGVSGHGALLQGRDFSFTVLQGGERGAAGTAAPPRYAVPAPPLFVNRVRQLDRARAFIADGGAHARILVVQASHRGGGASAFGLKALHDSYSEDPHRFPGGYFFADVERDGVMESVSEVLRRAGVPEEEIPAAQDRRRQRLRGEFDRRGAVAVMVDGPGSVNDVLPFAATSPGSLTLVATAHDLDLGEALPHVHDELVELDALDEEHSAELLCAKARLTPGREEERAAVAALVRLAGGRPELLLRYGRRLFRARRRMGVPEALEAVYREAAGEGNTAGASPGPRPAGRWTSGGGTSDRGPRTVHGDASWEASEPEERAEPVAWASPGALAVALACHPDTDFGEALALRLARLGPPAEWGREPAAAGGSGPGADADAVREALAALVEEEVLTVSGEGSGRRHRFLSARVRRACAARALDRDRFLREALTHYFERAAAAHRLLLPGRWLQADLDGRSAFPAGAATAHAFADREAARAFLDADRAALRATVIEAAVRGEYERAAELCEHLWALWFTSGRFADVVDTHTALLDQTLGTHRLPPARLSRLCVQRSIAYRRDDSLARAREDAERALELARAVAPPQPLVLLTALEAVGDAALRGGGTEEAADRFAEALEVAGTAGDPRAVRNALRKLGGVRLEQGREAEAEELLVRALESAAGDPVDDLQNRARLGAALGDLLSRRGRRGEALDRWARAAELHGRLGDHRRVGDMHLRRADALEPVDAAAARAALEEALAGYEAAEDRRRAERVRARLEAGPGR
ncbi:tetratricopeptide repeat protein [Nocardiopsis akebiae]|uniref:Tetratricopeptide repeat protein n=1 Tax=Nocardiopsis akebiae TaxID=2831968 RepID=A0ABX8BYW9_9ACTN|nr:tetratricopeptide repeat protein [Nocardiopsis akebiae]QUX27380.1 tetratricopeptide repeat protein [Nocardiopsis akebiae]